MFKSKMITILLVLLVIMNGTGFSQIYVSANASGSNNGSNWTNAYTNLQDALSAASSGDTIFVAEGTYYPDRGNGKTAGDRNESFVLKNGVILLGGYKGTEQFESMHYNIYWRNWQENKTILSGDLLNNDNDNVSPDEITRSDNSLHVIFSSAPVDSTAELNGFYIEGGNANSTDGFPGAQGGGIYLSNSTLRIKNCTFSNNTALESGGAVFANSGSLKIKFSGFINNSAKTGGAVTFFGADNMNDPRKPWVINSFFFNNIAEDKGAGIYNANAVNANIFNSVFSGNSLSGSSSSGAAIYNDNESYPEIINCTFYSNTSVSMGGGVTLSAGRIANSIFINNSASGNPQVHIEGSPANSSASRTFITSIVEGGFQGVQIYDLDPMFAAPGNVLGTDGLWGTPDDGLRIQNSSPVIDSGTTFLNTQKSDILGFPRLSNNVVDYGAYEHQRLNSDYQQILTNLKNGGYIIAFRHGITDHSQSDQDGYLEDLDNCSLQRNLNDEGIEQTKFIGSAIRVLGIPMDTALTSPMCRCIHTAENITGIYRKTPVWMGVDSNYTQAKIEDLGRPAKPGLNTIIVTHMNSVEEVTSYKRTEYQEGDAAVIRPLGGTSFEEVALITTDTWEKMINYVPSSPASINGSEVTPEGFVLYENYPNPFNPSTTIEYNIPSSQHVSLKVYDMLGKEIAVLVDDFRNAGKYRVSFDASGLASGVYFYRLDAGGYSRTMKLSFIK